MVNNAMIPYIYIRSDNGSPMFKRPDSIHPAIQLSLMLGSWAMRIRLWLASNFAAEKWTFLCKAAVKTGFEWSGYRIGAASMHISLRSTAVIAVG